MEPDLGLELETFPFLLLARHWGKVCQKKKWVPVCPIHLSNKYFLSAFFMPY